MAPVESLLGNGAAPLVIAHRGASAAAPENTMRAFEAAWAAGTDWIETDVQPTIDGEQVLIHDATVDRTTDGSGDVRDLTAHHLAGLDAGFRTTARSAGLRIPTLAGLLARLTPPRRVLLEIKGDHSDTQLRAILATVRAADLLGSCLFQSFEVPVLERLRVLMPDEPVGLLVEVIEPGAIDLCRTLGAVTYNPDVDELLAQPQLVAELHAALIAVIPWTVNERRQWAAVTELGVDGIITDYPAELARWQRENPTVTPRG